MCSMGFCLLKTTDGHFKPLLKAEKSYTDPLTEFPQYKTKVKPREMFPTRLGSTQLQESVFTLVIPRHLPSHTV